MRRILAAAAVMGALLPSRVALAEWTGRYLGSYQIHDEAFVDDSMRHLLDLHALDGVSRDLDLRLDFSFAYRLRPGYSGADLFQSRFRGELRNPRWRGYAQFTPWQDIAPGARSPRRRDLQLGFDLNPRTAPAIRVLYERRDNESVAGRSGTDDFRAGATYVYRDLATFLSYRRVDSRTSGGLALPSATDEWRGGLSGSKRWKSVTTSAGYNAEISSTSSGERDRKYYTQRVDLTAQWRPMRTVRVGGAGFTRWGKSEDSGFPSIVDIDEKFVNGSIGYMPIPELDFQAFREYRASRSAAGNLISDYARFQAILRKDLLRGLAFQNGYILVLDLDSQGGSLPRNTIYFLLDGRLRKGISMRGELRFAKTLESEISEGTQVRSLLGFRFVPQRGLRAEVTWWRDTNPQFLSRSEVDSLPPLLIPGQENREWEFLLGYEPSRALDLSGSLRLHSGQGRSRQESAYASATASYRFGSRSSLSATWNRRRDRLGSFENRTTSLSTDLSFWLPAEFRTKLTWTRAQSMRMPPANSYNISVEKRF